MLLGSRRAQREVCQAGQSPPPPPVCAPPTDALLAFLPTVHTSLLTPKTARRKTEPGGINNIPIRALWCLPDDNTTVEIFLHVIPECLPVLRPQRAALQMVLAQM